MSSEAKQIIIVVGLITNENGELLLQRRIDKLIPEADAKWEFPGGKIEVNETVEQALHREIKEEIDCEVSITRLLPLVQTKMWRTNEGVDWQVILIPYECRLESGTPVAKDKKVAEVRWFNRDDALGESNLLSGVIELIQVL